MKRARLTSFAAVALAAAALVFVPSSAQADHVGGTGAATGTLICQGTTATMTLDAPVFVFNRMMAPLHAEGSTPCDASWLSSDSGSGTADVTGPGVTCTGTGFTWIRIGVNITGGFGGQCLLYDGTVEGVLFHIEGTVVNGVFVATVTSPDTVMDLPNTTYGTGPVVGSLTCTAGQAAITVDAPVFVYDGVPGEVHATGTSACSGDLVSDVAIGGPGGLTWDMTAPGMTCAGMGGSWSYTGPSLIFWLAGDCDLDGGGVQRMQLFVGAAFAAGVGPFAGQGLLNPIP